MDKTTTTTQRTPAEERAYQLGRSRGAAVGHTEPSEADWEWFCLQTGGGDPEPAGQEIGWFETGMLDGAEQAQAARIGLAKPGGAR